jgi:hypothetical protein
VNIFISYRRADNQYLAQLVQDGLRARIPRATVFLDVASIAPGVDFEAKITREIGSCDVLIALIGPHWQPHRLHAAEDHVRRELLVAAEADKRIVPVLHSGGQPLQVGELPPDLAWLPQRNAFTFGDPTALADDLARLAALLTEHVPTLKVLRDQVFAHYERNAQVEVLRVAEEAWAEHGASASAGLADICRAAMLCLTMEGHLEARNLWLARALSTAFLARASNAFAACLLPLFFELVAAGRGDEARQVLVELARLTDADDFSQLPTGPTMRRIYHEKMAYSYFADDRLDEARNDYELALAATWSDPRAKQKVRAAVALCDYREGRAGEAIAVTEDVLRLAREHGWTQVAADATANLATMRAGTGPLVPYEVT